MAMPSKKVNEKVEARSSLTAVLLADSFTQRFRPITVERPKVLLPLVNAPLIEYTLEWLAYNYVEEVFVFCCAHADQITKYLNDSKWSKQTSIKVTTIVSTNCLSVGEALRLLDQKDVIKHDFILVSGDTVSNMKLQPVLEEHKRRREKDKAAIMTMVFKAVRHPLHRLRLGDSKLVVAYDPHTKRLLKYMEYDMDSQMRTTKLDASFFSERDAVEVRSDLMDTNICICAPEVLMLFSDNFDYQNLRRDFVSGVLSEEELGNKLHMYELGDAYAARVHNLRSYDAVSRDILQRWCFPLVPDTNLLGRGRAWGHSNYAYSRRHRYLEQGVNIDRRATVGVDVCVGAGTSIGEGSSVVQSVIGRDCRIGKGVVLTGCYVHDGVTVGDGAVLRHCLLCERCVVKAGAVVEPGVVLSYGVVVGPRHTVPRYARVALCQQLKAHVSLSDDELEYTNAGTPVRGRGARRAASDNDDDDDEDEDEGGDSLQQASSWAADAQPTKPLPAALAAAEAVAAGQPPDRRLGFSEEAVGPAGAGYAWDATDGLDVIRHSLAPPPAVVTEPGEGESEGEEDGSSLAGEGGDVEPEAVDPELSFKREVSETFLRCVQLGFSKDNAVIELNGLKIAENRTFADCARYVMATMLELCLPAGPRVRAEYAHLFPAAGGPAPTAPEGRRALLGQLTGLLKEWGPTLQRFLRTEDDQVELLLTFEEFCSAEGVFEGGGANGAAFAPLFAQVLKMLYDVDIVSEDAFMAWADEKAHADESERVYLNRAAGFIEWLRTADEEDDDDEED